MLLTEYYAGGFLPEAPAQNRALQVDTDADTFTRWAPDGTVTETRALTGIERAGLASSDSPPDLVAMADQLAAVAQAVDLLILESLGGI